MLESPLGPNVDVSNLREQYLFLRDQLHQRLQ